MTKQLHSCTVAHNSSDNRLYQPAVFMSNTHFYQTLYQSETLFRLENDPFPGIAPRPTVVTETLLTDTEVDIPLITEPEPASTLVSTSPAEPVAPISTTGPEPIVDEPVAVVLPIEKFPIREPELPAEQPVILEAAPARTLPSTHRPTPPEGVRPQLNHKVLILVDEELLPSDVLFLEKILNAINLNINGVDLLNVHGLDGVDFAPILADKVIHHFLTFGVPFQRLNLDILMDRYQPVRFHGITFMLADPLAAIEGDKNLKKRLWEALKRIFLMG